MTQFKNKCEEYGKYEISNKMSFQEFEKYLESKYPEEAKNSKANTFAATYDLIDPNKRINSFELFGYDFMITNDFNVYLIEVNTNPCLETPCSLLTTIISSVIDNSFRLTLDPLTYMLNSKTTQLGDSASLLTKFELVFDEKFINNFN